MLIYYCMFLQHFNMLSYLVNLQNRNRWNSVYKLFSFCNCQGFSLLRSLLPCLCHPALSLSLVLTGSSSGPHTVAFLILPSILFYSTQEVCWAFITLLKILFIFCGTGVWTQGPVLSRHSSTWATPPALITLFLGLLLYFLPSLTCALIYKENLIPNSLNLWPTCLQDCEKHKSFLPLHALSGPFYQ
jgi:hypothetical protein